jgi:3-oxoacyl-[acyl-carrier protein] reductase
MSTTTKIVLVTGANRGIGRAMAHRFGREGFHVIIAARDEAKAKVVASEIMAAGG